MNKNYVSHSFEHTLEVEGPPIAQKPRRINPENTKELNAQIEERLRLNVIQPSTSPWSSPVHLVKKKTITWRFTIDYRHSTSEPSPFPTRCLLYMISQQTLVVLQCLVRVTSKTHFGNFLFDFLTENSQSFVHHVAISNF